MHLSPYNIIGGDDDIVCKEVLPEALAHRHAPHVQEGGQVVNKPAAEIHTLYTQTSNLETRRNGRRVIIKIHFIILLYNHVVYFLSLHGL